ncbi:MAG: hypothetical protein KAJ04_02545, partial [Candidatus Eisenbacteria sp.]|nr:hypothetical protein [Candidatus Eisenbacteria bacterium]
MILSGAVPRIKHGVGPRGVAGASHAECGGHRVVASKRGGASERGRARPVYSSGAPWYNGGRADGVP